LISHAANANQPNHDGSTSLHLTCRRYGHQEAALQLIDHGADINIKNA
jgi:ankyrin repeat protein